MVSAAILLRSDPSASDNGGCSTSFPESGPGYERWSRARARHGRSTSSTGSQSANVDSREGDFGFSPDSGRGPGAALTGSFDPERTLGPSDGLDLGAALAGSLGDLVVLVLDRGASQRAWVAPLVNGKF